jgi:taurine dioxygenase
MSALQIGPLREDLSFGARVRGVGLGVLDDPQVRARLWALFEERGVIVFEGVDPSARMHVALSNVFGPLKEHPSPAVPRVDGDSMPGVIEMRAEASEDSLIELGGRRIAHWLPWHFDHCYNDQLNRAGVLRAIEIPPEGGLTGFADGVELYRALPEELRRKIEGRQILYRMNVILDELRFGRPEGMVVIAEMPDARPVMDAARGAPRAVHPAVWTRKSGEKVLHVSPWMAEGIEGQEDAEGDALLDAVCREIGAAARERAYFHRWKPTEMLVWDNWRVLHCVSGHDPAYARCMQRTTIQGDYGLGRFEHGPRVP